MLPAEENCENVSDRNFVTAGSIKMIFMSLIARDSQFSKKNKIWSILDISDEVVANLA